MDVKEFEIEGVKLITPRKFGDARGFFMETYNAQRYKEAGIEVDFVQDNMSLSRVKGVIRGLHFQVPPHPQAKLVSVLDGRILDVAVDLRRGSATYGRHVAAELDAESGAQLFVPAGFAHGFCTLEPDTRVSYKVSGLYAPDCDAGIKWDDPDLGIDWPVRSDEATVSEKDGKLPSFADFDTPF